MLIHVALNIWNHEGQVSDSKTALKKLNSSPASENKQILPAQSHQLIALGNSAREWRVRGGISLIINTTPY